MNAVLESLHVRKSVRAYEDREILPEAKAAILAAAVAAPSGGNQQMYTILDITDQAIKDKLAVSCDNQPFIAKAKMVLVFCADFQKWFDAFREAGLAPRKPGVGDLMIAVSDANIAAQNAVVAAESLGIGSCYIGDIMEQCEQHRALLKLPEFVFPAAMLVFGWPTAQQKARPKPERSPMQYIVHENGYRRLSGAELRGMLQKELHGETYEAWCAALLKRKYEAAFSLEMSRSVKEYLKAFE